MTASSRRSRFWLYNSTYFVIMLAKSRCGLCPAGAEGMFCVPGACYKNNAMLCLQCHRWQPKQAWSPAQWKAVNPVLLDHSRNCCSDCSINWWCPAPSPRPTTSPCEGATRGAATGARRDHEPGWVQSVLVVLRIRENTPPNKPVLHHDAPGSHARACAIVAPHGVQEAVIPRGGQDSHAIDITFPVAIGIALRYARDAFASRLFQLARGAER